MKELVDLDGELIHIEIVEGEAVAYEDFRGEVNFESAWLLEPQELSDILVFNDLDADEILEIMLQLD
jgi:hypothetical protein